MPAVIKHLVTFLWAVWDHVFTLAAGCVVTVIINLFEKHVRKKAFTWKVDLAVMLCFLFFSCFQAWQDQYTRVESLLHPPAMPQVVVNNPVTVSPTPVIVNPPQVTINQPKTEGAYISLENIGFVKDGDVIAAGRTVSVNAYQRKVGDEPLIYIFMSRFFVGESAKQGNNFRSFVKEANKVVSEAHGAYATKTSYGNASFFDTLISPTLTQHDVDDITSGKKHLYILQYIAWKGVVSGAKSEFACNWIQPDNLLIHSC